MKWHKILYFLFITGFIFSEYKALGQVSGACDPLTPSFIVNLAGKADSAWLSPNVRRVGLCCGLDPNARPPIRCVEFILTLDTGAQGIRFDIASGAVPPGALGYQINCGKYYMVGADICLDGPGPHRLTFCEPGNNPNTYTIISIPKPKVSPPVIVSDGCSATLSASGFQVSTIRWTSVPYNATYNSYLNCTVACTTVIATYQVGAPPYVDYEVSGIPAGGCTTTPVKKTTRVYFVNDKVAKILPEDPTICYGGSNATLTAYGTGGMPPYTYLWSNGATTQSISVGVGTYTVEIKDASSCPSAKATTTVTAFLSPITANAGPDETSCVNNPSVTLAGSVSAAKGGIWSKGTGTYTPSDTVLNAIYTPSPSEIAAGSTTLILTTTGNGSCPSNADTMRIFFLPSPIVNAGPDITVCANKSQVNLNGSVVNATGGTWTGGTGIFAPDRNTLNATYSPSAAEIASGSFTLTLTTTGNGPCLPVSDDVVINITPPPTINAGSDITVCANKATVNLSATVTVATSGTWTGGTGAFSPNRNVLNPNYTPSTSEKNAGFVVLVATSTGNGNCIAVSDDIRITITPAPVVHAGVDRTVCTNKPSLQLNGTVTVSTGGIWSGGSGTYTPFNTTLNATYVPSAAEIAAGKAVLTLTSTGNGQCNPVSDNMVITITPAPTVNAGIDKIVCGNNASVLLSGTVTVASGGTWSGGTGTYSPNANSLSTQYTPSGSEIINGSVTLTLSTSGNGNCLPATDNIFIQITPSPTVDAGPDVTVCSTTSSVPLNGSVTVATGGLWKTSGTGSFSPNANTLNASYVPSSSDITSGTITLTLTSTSNGNCIPVNDFLILKIDKQPIANVGPDRTICADVNSITLAGSVTNATGGIWSSSGTGSFTPGNTTLNASYVLTAADKSSSPITLTLTTTNNGVCGPVSSPLLLTITPAPSVDAGPDINACYDAIDIQLNGTVLIAAGGVWSSSGTGSFSPSPSSLSAKYIPSASDKSTGHVTLQLTSKGNGSCQPLTDALTINITQAPTINAGPDLLVCSDNPGVTLSGSVTTAGGATWSGGSGTFNPDRNTLTATYTPTAFEITSGTVALTLTSTNNGTCNPVKDDLIISITPAPLVNAGPDQNLCGDVTSVQLNGTAQNTSAVAWITNGTGSFVNSNSLVTDYIPSQADTNSHTVTLKLSVEALPGCNSIFDLIVIDFSQSSSIFAGPDQSVCETKLPVQLQASGSKAKWSGAGTFSPNDSTFNATYIPTSTELSSGSASLTITTISNSVCLPISDDVTITFVKGPEVNAGDDITVCADTAGVQLNGTSLDPNAVKWFTSGSGTFSPDAFALNAIYVPSASDINAGTITLTLSSTGNTICDPVTDFLILTITPAPTINAGFDQTVCGNAGTVQLNGSVTVATGGKWSTIGLGGFSLSDEDLNATYSLTDADTSAHQITFKLTTIGFGMCKPVSDEVKISITSIPVVVAGKDTSVCKDLSVIALSGLVANSTGTLWSTTGTGYFSPTPGTNSVDYNASLADRNSGSVTLTLTANGTGACSSKSNSILITFTTSPTVSAGPDQTICADSNKISLVGSVTVAAGGIWSTTGTGTFTSPENLETDYLVSPEDSASGQIILKFTTTGNGTCNPVEDDMIFTITPAPTVNAGSDLLVCSDIVTVAIFGSATEATGGAWSTSGSGTFSPIDQLNSVYTLSNADTTNGSVILTLTTTGGSCKAIKDQMLITLTPVPVIDAGTTSPICKDETMVPIYGYVYNAGGGKWSTSGSGTFEGINDLSTNYLPSISDKGNTKVKLFLTSTGIGTCKPVMDSLEIFINPGPQIYAGADQIICADAESVPLSGEVFLAEGGQWTTSGTGTFEPNDSTLNAFYKPTDADTAAGSLYLYLTSRYNLGCNAVKDSILLTITPTPKIKASQDQLICASQTNINLSSSVNIATGGKWESSGTGNFIPDNFSLNTSYAATSSDKLNGVRFIVTSTGNGTCKSVKDTLNVLFSPIPTVTAGSSTICADNSGAPLSGSFANATGIIWTTTGSGNFMPSDTDVNTSYNPSASDFITTYIKIAITTTGSGACPPATDTIAVTIKPAPIVEAGDDQTVCADNPAIQVSGTVTYAGGGIWSSSGTGSFTSDPNQQSTTYNPSLEDINTAHIKIYLTTTGNGDCNPRQDSLLLTINPKPTIKAIGDPRICPDQTSLDLSGLVTVATGGEWTTDGGGAFSSSSTLSTSYSFSDEDYSAIAIKFILTSTGNDLCKPVKDSLIMQFYPLPTIDPLSDQAVCRDVEAIAFYANYTVATGINWSSNGTGAFSDTETSLTKYYPSEADKDLGMVKIYVSTKLGSTCKQVRDTAYLQITPNPTATTIPDQIVCVDTDIIPLSGSVTHATGGEWTTSGSGSFLPNSSSLNTSYALSTEDKNSGFVELILSTTGNIGCFNTDSVDITIYPAPEILLDSISACVGETIQLNAQPVNIPLSTNATFTWYKDNDKLVDSISSITITKSGLYQVTYSIGSCSRKDTSYVVFHPIPVTDMNHQLEFCKEKNFNIALDAGPGDHYLWLQSGNTGKQEIVEQPGLYYVKVFNKYNCVKVDSVNLDDICPPRLFVPSIFSPNGDGSNDHFKTFGKYFTAYKLTVFNRWGEIIFYSEDAEKTWDGYYLGDPMPNGVYAWICYYEGLTEKYKGPYKLEGSITVDR